MDNFYYNINFTELLDGDFPENGNITINHNEIKYDFGDAVEIITNGIKTGQIKNALVIDDETGEVLFQF